MKNEELTDEELKIIQQHREYKVKTEAIKAAETALKNEVCELEGQFTQILKEVSSQIAAHLEQANLEIEKARALSEESGIPFKSYIDGMPRSRQYTPESFNEKWGKLGNILYEYDFYIDESGWQFWNESSLTC